ncbi:MAG: hypothetical protein ABW019_00230, partial [Chitinophagaceae bacterium]
PSLLLFREKRKWQIALRRYVIDKNPCLAYAPYFGLDINTLRAWFEIQLENGNTWDDFGKQWQFDHIIPVTYFDFSIEEDLVMCWNFTNIRVEQFDLNKNRGNRVDVLGARRYFEELYKTTGYEPCRMLLNKLDQLEQSELVSSVKQQEFIKTNKAYLDQIVNYTEFEFDLLNRGRSTEEVNKEIALIKKLGK